MRKIDSDLMDQFPPDSTTRDLIKDIHVYLESKKQKPEDMITILKLLTEHYRQAKKSKYGKPGKWNFIEVCEGAAPLIYEYFKDNYEPGYGRRIASKVKRGKLWELNGGEAWDAFDALASQSNVDPAFLPMINWLSNLADFHQWAKR